jgi:hypothetical protein
MRFPCWDFFVIWRFGVWDLIHCMTRVQKTAVMRARMWVIPIVSGEDLIQTLETRGWAMMLR